MEDGWMEGWSECLWETETQTKRLTGTWLADISLVVWYSMNETPLVLVCLDCVCEKRWWCRNKEPSRDLCSSDRETKKRWRDKMQWPRQKSETEIARVGNNLFSLCAWLAGVLYLAPSPNTACLHTQTQKKSLVIADVYKYIYTEWVFFHRNCLIVHGGKTVLLEILSPPITSSDVHFCCLLTLLSVVLKG